MKNVLRFLAIGAITAASALSAFAQTTTATPAPAQGDAAKVCADLYAKWRENYNKPDANVQKMAAEVGREFMTKCPSDEYISYVDKWLKKYDAAVGKVELDKQFKDAFTAKNWKTAIGAAKQISANDPENLGILLSMAYIGTQGMAGKTGDMSLAPDATAAARNAMRFIESGKADAYGPEKWKEFGFKSKEDTVAWLNYASGFFAVNNSPAEAASYFVKTAQLESDLKKDPTTYYYLASAYQKAEYAPLVTDYQANCAGKDLTDECKMKLEKMNLVVDRIIDAYARAVSFANKPELNATKAEWMKTLTDLYKFRHEDKVDGLNDYIAGIQSKPLLLPSMQTQPVAPTPSTTPSTGTAPTGTASTTAPANAPAPKPADTSAPKPTPKPGTATNGVKP